MMRMFLILSLMLGLAACQSNPTKPMAVVEGSEGKRISAAERKATPAGRKILTTGRRMTLVNQEILPGGCWDYANAVYNRAGYPSGKRKTVFQGAKRRGPYADINLVQPGDWLYYINHQYGRIEHSAIFVAWEDAARKRALMLSYGGEGRRQPARYRPYDLSNIYQIVRADSGQ